jgi:hypothetical protein
MNHHALEELRRSHPAWRLLAAAYAPFVIGFLHESFVAPNVRTLPRDELQRVLEDYLARLRERLGADALPRRASEYLDEWARDDHGWLRKYYPETGDEPHFDITPATEKAIEWVMSLRRRRFVGTESRLLTVFDLLRQIVDGAEENPDVRLAELERRRAQLDAEIERARRGEVDVMGPTQIRDRFLQLAATARALLTDFREVEQNFRELDRTVRERIATWEGGKGELLEEIFGRRDAIRDSDQGKSFHAFWDFLMAPSRQEELTTMLEKVLSLDAVRELEPDRRLLRVHYDWLAAGEVAQRMVARLSQQLRRYLDDRAWLENRRIMQILRAVEQHALAVRNSAPTEVFMEIDDLAPAIALPLDRPLFAPSRKHKITARELVSGEETADASALYDQVYVDKGKLAAHVRRALQSRDQVSLSEIILQHPLELGLAELVGYFGIAADDPEHSVIDESRSERIEWLDLEGQRRVATFPSVLFLRRSKRSA